MNTVAQKTIVCIPGLGGHPSAFGLYEPLLGEFKFRYLEITNIERAIRDLQKILDEEKHAVLFCSCYGIQYALHAAESTPQAVDGIIIVEPFFAEFQWWRLPALGIARGLLGISKITDRMGLRRRKFNYHPDYVKLSRYPIYLQPVFDMLWHNITDYLDKIRDLLSFKLPAVVDTPTLIIFAPHGFIKSKKDKINLGKIFTRGTVVEMADGTHNIITMSGEPVARAVRAWIHRTIP